MRSGCDREERDGQELAEGPVESSGSIQTDARLLGSPWEKELADEL